MAGAAPLLLGMLDAGSNEARECGLGAVANLSNSRPAAETLAAAAAVPALLRFLRRPHQSSPVLQDLAVGVLNSLAFLSQAQVRPNSTLVSEVASSVERPEVQRHWK